MKLPCVIVLGLSTWQVCAFYLEVLGVFLYRLCGSPLFFPPTFWAKNVLECIPTVPYFRTFMLSSGFLFLLVFSFRYFPHRIFYMSMQGVL